jgi:hypothetical protein
MAELSRGYGSDGRRRRNLVIVRAGDNSLHPTWLRDSSDRSWDLLVSYFGDDTERFRQPGIIRIDSKGPKWPALGALIMDNRKYIEQYDYIWLPDDDIACQGSDINHLFKMAADYKLHLSQPALTLDSYFSWLATLRNPLLRVRFVNFVEIMVPCFSREFLLRSLPFLADNLSGWGLDHLWPTMLHPNQMAILDAIAVTHTRPIGGANYSFLRERGIQAYQERDEFKSVHGIGDTIIRTEAVETVGGLKLGYGSFLMSALLRWGYAYAVARAYVMHRANRMDFRGKRLRRAMVTPANYPG